MDVPSLICGRVVAVRRVFRRVVVGSGAEGSGGWSVGGRMTNSTSQLQCSEYFST